MSAAIKVCLVQLIAMCPPDLPSRLYASGSAKTNEEEGSTGKCSGRHEYNPELFVTTTAASRAKTKLQRAIQERNGDAVEVSPPVPAPEDEAAT